MDRFVVRCISQGKVTRNSSGDEIAKRDFSVYLFIIQLYKSLNLCNNIEFSGIITRWLTGRALDLRIADTGFDSRPGRCRVKILGKFLTPMCNVVLYNII